MATRSRSAILCLASADGRDVSAAICCGLARERGRRRGAVDLRREAVTRLRGGDFPETRFWGGDFPFERPIATVGLAGLAFFFFIEWVVEAEMDVMVNSVSTERTA